MRLGGFNKEELKELSEKMLKLHSSVYGWDASALVTPYLDEIVNIHESAEFTGGKIIPRKYVRTFISFLDTIQQNPEDLDSKDEILGLFEKEEEEEEW